MRAQLALAAALACACTSSEAREEASPAAGALAGVEERTVLWNLEVLVVGHALELEHLDQVVAIDGHPFLAWGSLRAILCIGRGDSSDVRELLWDDLQSLPRDARLAAQLYLAAPVPEEWRA